MQNSSSSRRVCVRWLRFACALSFFTNAHFVDAAGFINAAPMSRARIADDATLLLSGKVLVVAGSGPGYLSTTELYDAASNSWAPGGALSLPRVGSTSTLLTSGIVLAVGGGLNSFSTYVDFGERYDPATNAWNVTTPMLTGRGSHTATRLASGRVLVVGGFGSSGRLASAEQYDPASDAWSAAGSLSTARSEHTATLLASGKVLVAGGYGQNGNLASAELYDPATNAWSAAGSLSNARSQHTATLLKTGKVLVVGGDGPSGRVSVTEIYDPVSNAWSPAAPLAVARDIHTATLLASGKVLVVGGYDFPVVMASAVVYSPETDSWADAGTLLTGRLAHTATLLPNGRVLIAGGRNVSGTLASAELYAPDTHTTITASSPATTVVGQNYRVDFSVAAVAGSSNGNVVVSDDRGASCGPVVLLAGAGSCSLVSTAVGNRVLTASYTPADSVLSVSEGLAVHTVFPASTVLSTTVTPEPASPADVATVSVLLDVSAPGAGSPSGWVTVTQMDSGASCIFQLPTSSCTLPPSTVGSHLLGVTYAGDTNFLASSTTRIHTVNAYNSDVEIGGIAPEISVVGQPVSISYSVSAADGAPSGSVTIHASTGETCSGLLSAGHCDLVFTSSGGRVLTAEYAGDATHAPADSAGTAYAVNPAATALSIVSHAPDPSLPSQLVTVDVTLAAVSPGSGNPAGSIAVSDGVNSCVIPQAGTGCGLALTTRGSHTLTATYAGDSNYVSSSVQAMHAVNSLPIPASAVYSTNEDAALKTTGITGLLSQASDPDGDVLVVTNAGTIVASGIGGSVVLNADGSFSYTPPADANGVAMFDYTISDGLESVSASATIAVGAINDPPSFTLASIAGWPAGTSGAQMQSGFANVSSMGAANESDQQVQAWHVRTINDPNGVASNASITLDGTLSYALSGHAGSATFGVALQDDGGIANGGIDTSPEQTFTIAVAAGLDLSITMDDGSSFAPGGGLVEYIIGVQNMGPNDAIGAKVRDLLPFNLIDANWMCVASAGASCAANGNGDIDDTVSIPGGGSLTYLLDAHVVADPEAPLVNTATVIAPVNVPDLNAANDTATDTDQVGIFADGWDLEILIKSKE